MPSKPICLSANLSTLLKAKSDDFITFNGDVQMSEMPRLSTASTAILRPSTQSVRDIETGLRPRRTTAAEAPKADSQRKTVFKWACFILSSLFWIPAVFTKLMTYKIKLIGIEVQDFTVKSTLHAVENLHAHGKTLFAVVVFIWVVVLPLCKFSMTVLYLSYPKYRTPAFIRRSLDMGRCAAADPFIICIYYAACLKMGLGVELYDSVFYFFVFCIGSTLVSLWSYYSVLEKMPARQSPQRILSIAIFCTFMFSMYKAFTMDLIHKGIKHEVLVQKVSDNFGPWAQNMGSWIPEFQGTVSLYDIIASSFLPEARAEIGCVLVCFLGLFPVYEMCAWLALSQRKQNRTKFWYHPHFFRYLSFLDVFMLSTICCYIGSNQDELFFLEIKPAAYWMLLAFCCQVVMRKIN